MVLGWKPFPRKFLLKRLVCCEIREPPILEAMEKGAIISDCGKFRFQLWRIWNKNLPLVFWLMHNPSTADGEQDDPTIRRVTGFTAKWGYGGFYVGNLFPYRATNPNELLGKRLIEIVPVEQLKHVDEMKQKCKLCVLAFGNPVLQGINMSGFDEGWHYLKLTKAGYPCHPLYLKGDLTPQKYAP